MPPKVRIEEVLPSGERVTITLEGRQLTKARVLQVLDMLNLMGGIEEGSDEGSEHSSLKDKIWEVIVEHYGEGNWFTLKELHRVLLAIDPELKITTVAAYLARFVSEGCLAKKGQKPMTLYKVRSSVARAKI
ncbi:MAG: hypothetical protein RMI04_03305 [Thermofilaceae archaeon]|nr:hypothetical protein [Thermofilaceae archaeon]